MTAATGGTKTAAALWLFNNKFYVVSNNVSSGEVMYNELGLQQPEVVKEISAKATGNWSEVSLERIADMNADYLFLVNSDKGQGRSVEGCSLAKYSCCEKRRNTNLRAKQLVV